MDTEDKALYFRQLSPDSLVEHFESERERVSNVFDRIIEHWDITSRVAQPVQIWPELNLSSSVFLTVSSDFNIGYSGRCNKTYLAFMLFPVFRDGNFMNCSRRITS